MRLPPRRWLILACLALLPATLYWNTIFHRYGFRDDYSILRESHEEPGKVTLVCAMQARPIYGVLMERSFALLRGIDDLRWLRLLSALLLGTIAATSFAILRRLNWDGLTAALLAALVTVLPGSQLLVGWTVGWPLGVAVLLALAGFACAEKAFQETELRRVLSWVAAVLLVAASALTYQSNSLFYLVPVAAGLWPRRKWEGRAAIQWFVRHLVTVGLGLMLAFTVMMVAFAENWVPTSQRVALEHDWPGKLAWFVEGPLQNALGLIALNDDDGSLSTRLVALLVAFVLSAGIARECLRRGLRRGAWSAVAVGVLVVGSFSVNLLVADRWPMYRVLLPLTCTLAVLMTSSLLGLGGRKLARVGLAILVVVGAWLAHWQAFELIARPQGIELAVLERGAVDIAPADRPRVFVITPTEVDRVARRSFRDEFGSLSTDSDWVPKEMLQAVMHERFAGMADVIKRYTFDSGRKKPAAGDFDVVIDLRRLRDYSEKTKIEKPHEAIAEAVPPN